jgi:hypothetical protein
MEPDFGYGELGNEEVSGIETFTGEVGNVIFSADPAVTPEPMVRNISIDEGLEKSCQ